MYIKKKEDFLFESYLLKLINEKYLNFSNRFNDILYSNPLNPIFFEIIKNREVDKSKVDFIDLDPDSDSIRFVSGDKTHLDYVDYSSKYTNTSMKIGRFLRMLYTELSGKTPSDKDIEEAVNIIKAASSKDKLEIVEDEEIRKCYLESNYYNNNGSLGNSCMRFESKSLLLDIYVENCKLLVLKKDGKVTGRAIIWDLENGKFLDRIYTNSDSDVLRFKKYAIDNKYLSKRKQEFNNTSNIEDYNGNLYSDVLVAKINKIYEYYPYMDTMKYLDNKGNLRSVSSSSNDLKLTYEGNEVVYSKYEDRILFTHDTNESNRYGILSRENSTLRNGDYYPNKELILDVTGSLDVKENLIYNKEFDFYYDKNSKLIDVDFFGKKVKMPDDSRNIISLGTFRKKFYWKFSIIEINHEFYKDIPTEAKKDYKEVEKEIEKRKDMSLYKVIMSYSNIFKLGKVNNRDYSDFASVVGDLSELISDNTNISYFKIYDFIKIYFFRKFNEINYPNLVNKKKFKLFGEGYTFEDFTLDDMEYVKELYLDGLTDIKQLSLECDLSVDTVKQIINTLKRRGDINED